MCLSTICVNMLWKDSNIFDGSDSCWKSTCQSTELISSTSSDSLNLEWSLLYSFMPGDKFEKLFKIIKFGKWSVKSYIRLPLIIKCSIELKNILSINVAEWSVILVGWKIWGWKKHEPKELIKFCESVWESIFKRSIGCYNRKYDCQNMK